jgi:hypothetical protein
MFRNIKKIFLLSSAFAVLIGSAQGQVFLEQSSSIGIDHEFQERALMGGGAVFFDYDNDGDEDLYLTSGLAQDHLYINNGDGTFSRDLSANGLRITIRYNTIGANAADIDNDGDRDLLVTTWEWYNGSGAPIGNNLLFENNGDGTFTEISIDAGLVEEAFSTSSAFFDFNNDGFLDLYISNYVDKPGFIRDSTGFVIGYDSDCYENFFYINNGDGTFTNVSSEMMVNDEGCSLATIASDYDMDGDLDLYSVNDYGPDIIPNVFYENQFPEINFENKSSASGLGIAIYSMGVTSADYDHDGDFDYYVTNLGENALMRNDDGVFHHSSAEAGVSNEWVDEFTYTTGWGALFTDVDNDSWDDLFVSNGRIASIPSLPTSMTDPNKLYRNSGEGTFEDISVEAGINNTFYGRGVAHADFDNDGDQDLVVVFLSEQGGKTQFYVNQGNNENHYAQFRLKGIDSNRDGIGAKVFVYLEENVMVKELFGGGSFCSQSSNILHFGLAENTIIDSVRIEWPSSHVDMLYNLTADSLYHIEEYLDFNSSVEDVIEVNSYFKIFPNPTSDWISISIENAETDVYEFRLINLRGELINSWSNQNGKTRLQLSSYLPGMYFLSATNSKATLIKSIFLTP